MNRIEFNVRGSLIARVPEDNFPLPEGEGREGKRDGGVQPQPKEPYERLLMSHACFSFS